MGILFSKKINKFNKKIEFDYNLMNEKENINIILINPYNKRTKKLKINRQKKFLDLYIPAKVLTQKEIKYYLVHLKNKKVIAIENNYIIQKCLKQRIIFLNKFSLMRSKLEIYKIILSKINFHQICGLF